MGDSQNPGRQPELARPAAPPTELAPTVEQLASGAAGSSATVQYEPSGNTMVEKADRPEAPPRLSTPPGYEVLGELGRGGMGVVYLARQKGLDRLVALKMLLAGEHADAEHLARFRIEAQAVASLQHPNIVQIHEIGELNGLPFFSLEFVPGGSLSKKIAGKPQLADDSARLVESIARAIHVAHGLGIVHRDLKPANILLAYSDHSSASALLKDPLRQKVVADGSLRTAIAKISDFGLAKRLEMDSRQTRSGAIMGSPSYMAPEQARGEVHQVGPLADVYATGAILYELLTGRPPFLAATPIATVQQVANSEPVTPSRLEPNVPHDLETICLKCLQKEPHKRYESAEALADDLQRFLRREPIHARPVGALERLWRWCLRNPRLAAATAASVALLLLATSVSTWAAITLANKNDVIENEKQAALNAKGEAEESARIASEQEQAALKAQAEAEENAKIASDQSTLAVRTIQLVVQQVQRRLSDAPATQAIRKEILDIAIENLKRVADKVDESTSKDATQLAILRELGTLFQQLGEASKSFEQFRQAEDLARERVIVKNGSDSSRLNLALILHLLGHATQEVNRDMRAAQKCYEESLRIRQDVLDKPFQGDGNAAVPDVVRFDLSESHARVGTTIYRLGNPAAALPHFQEALELRSQLSESYPPGAALPDNRMRSLPVDIERTKLAIGEMSFRLGDRDKANAIYAAGTSTFDGYLLKNSAVVSLKHETARIHGNYGDILLYIDGPAAALPHYESFRKAMQELSEYDSYESIYKRDLALAHYRLGNLARRSNEPATAREHYQESLRLREALVAVDESNDRRQLELMLALAHCGDHARAAGIAERYRSSESPDNELLIDVARCFAQCSAAVENDPDLQSRYAMNAISSLTAAVAQDYRDAEYLEFEPDFDPLQGRDDFRTLVRQASQ
jgi:serine/threonine protein kinase